MKLALFSLLIFFLAMLVDAKPGDRRIDEEEKYWNYQEIQKELDNTDKKSWMFYRTLRSTNRAKNKCVYAEVKEKKEEEEFYEFVQGYINGDKIKVEETLYAFPYKTDPTGPKDREKNNAMLVTKQKDKKDGRKYVLIYSDYKCCAILRSLADEYGAACELYLHDNCVSQDVPKLCASMYGNACGRGDAYKHQVYDKSCKNEIDVTTKPTSEGTETPEKITTTSTLPPGC